MIPLLATGTVACTLHEPRKREVPNSPKPSANAPSPPYDAPPNGGAVQVLEKGFSATINGDTKAITYGIVFENSGDHVAFLTDVTIRMIDQSGKPIIDKTRRTPDIARQVRVILPGQRTGIGGTSYVDDIDVAALDVEVGKSAWWPIKNDFREFAKIDTRDVSVTLAPNRNEATLTFLIESGFESFPHNIWAWIVFRGNTGKITGGTTAMPVQFEISADDGNKALGKARVTSGIPTAVDPPKTAVYLLNDCC